MTWIITSSLIEHGRHFYGLFRTVPLKLKDKDRGTEPQRSKTDYPWFWCEENLGQILRAARTSSVTDGITAT
ncbi:MAG: hypothetical protein AUK55_14000 [Syntrophobacteraceae bacterium CG2_30_61_12]|nr:MAG: hypothetical protein AUK55_14000 [Syntrophobacteraceae bacterium CG2_30_61_12]